MKTANPTAWNQHPTGMARPAAGRRQWLALVLILALAALPRGLYLAELLREPALTWPILDGDFHHYWARSLATGDWTPPAGVRDPLIPEHPFSKPPGYPYFLALVYRLATPHHVAGLVAQALLSLLNVALVWLLGRRLAGPAVGALAALGMALWWPMTYFIGELIDPTLVMTLSLALLLTCAGWRRQPRLSLAILAGVLLGVLALVRTNFILLAPPLAIWALVVARGRLGNRRALAQALALALGVTLAVAPVTLRNRVVGGEWVLITANGGLNLYIGNHELSDQEAVQGPLIDELLGSWSWSLYDFDALVRGLERRLGHPVGYAGCSRWFASQALDYMRHNPAQTLGRIGRRAWLMLGPVEVGNIKVIELDRRHSAVLSRLPGDFSMIVALGGLGIALWLLEWRRRTPPPPRAPSTDHAMLALALITMAVLFASYLPFFMESRFRAPLAPPLLIFGGLALTRLWSLARSRHRWWAAGLAALALASWALLRLTSLAHPPSEASWHHLRGETLYWQGRHEAALPEYEAAFRLDPTQPLIQLGLGRNLYSLERPVETIPYLALVVEQAPQDIEAHSWLGLAWLAIDRPREAEASLLRALRLDPTREDLRRLLERTRQGPDGNTRP